MSIYSGRPEFDSGMALSYIIHVSIHVDATWAHVDPRGNQTPPLTGGQPPLTGGPVVVDWRSGGGSRWSATVDCRWPPLTGGPVVAPVTVPEQLSCYVAPLRWSSNDWNAFT
ncbi:hypothetical protein Tco_1229946 [Tanacetum coccineum]